MDPKIIKFIIWLALVCLWNFGVPGAAPIYDVIAAVLLSFDTQIKLPSKFENNSQRFTSLFFMILCC